LGCFDRIMFSWTTPIFKFVGKKTLHIDHLGELREKDYVEKSIVRLKRSWSLYKHQAIKSKHALLKATFHAFKCKFELKY